MTQNLPKGASALVAELNRVETERDRLRSALMDMSQIDIGPFTVAAGVSVDITSVSDVWEASFCVSIHGGTRRDSVTEDVARRLLEARQHYDRWMRGEESAPLPDAPKNEAA